MRLVDFSSITFKLLDAAESVVPTPLVSEKHNMGRCREQVETRETS